MKWAVLLLAVFMLTACSVGSSPPPKPLLVHQAQVLELYEYPRTMNKEIIVGWNDLRSTGVATYRTSSANLYDSLKIGSKVKIFERGGDIKGLIKETAQ
jgi:hypothetical protein